MKRSLLKLTNLMRDFQPGLPRIPACASIIRLDLKSATRAVVPIPAAQHEIKHARHDSQQQQEAADQARSARSFQRRALVAAIHIWADNVARPERCAVHRITMRRSAL